MRLPEGLRARVAAYAEAKALTLDRATAVLIDAGLRSYERAVGAGKARAAARTPDEQRAAVRARWARSKTGAQAAARQA